MNIAEGKTTGAGVGGRNYGRIFFCFEPLKQAASEWVGGNLSM